MNVSLPFPYRIAVTANAFSKNPLLRESLQTIFPNCKFNETGKRFCKEELSEFLEGVDGAIVGLDVIDKSIVENHTSLKIISKYGVGLDNIDIKICEENGIAIGWSGGVNRLSVAEMTLGFMLSLSRNLYQTSSQLSQGIWNKSGGTQLSGKTIGIIGVGHIAKELIRLLNPFDCTILANDIIEQKDYYQQHNIQSVSQETIFKESDIITLHTPLTKDTHHLINRTTLHQMKPTACLINTARGGIVNQEDLKQALKEGVIASAAVDAYEKEPPMDKELLSFHNFFCTPHIGGNSKEAVLAMGESAIAHLNQFFQGYDHESG